MKEVRKQLKPKTDRLLTTIEKFGAKLVKFLEMSDSATYRNGTTTKFRGKETG